MDIGIEYNLLHRDKNCGRGRGFAPQNILKGVRILK
jgi:hypothetical protein